MAIAGGQQKGTPGEALLGAALHQEEVEGNLEAAIASYKKFLASRPADRALAAKAQFHIGLCYEKLGHAEARKAYEQLLRDYPEQGELVTQARTRLAAPAGGRGITIRQISAGPGPTVMGAPSPDGRHLTFVDWESGNLALRDLVTGQTRRITSDGVWSDHSEWAEFSVVSPDGKHVAYQWFNKDLFYELRVLTLDGSKPRVVLRDKELIYAWPSAWTPDGQQILANLQQKDYSYRIAFVSVADGSVKVLKSLDWHYPDRMSLSPDGRYIVYDAPAREGSFLRDIFLLSADGQRETRLVGDPADDRHPIWTPDGEQVLFTSDRAGPVSLWGVTVADGRPAGVPRLVKPDLGRVSDSLGMTRQGAYYYELDLGTEDVYLAEMDPATGKLARPPEHLPRFVGSNLASSFSRDGRYLAYFSRRGGFSGPGDVALVIRSIESGEERELRVKPYIRATPVRWYPDGRSLVVAVRETEWALCSFYRVDTQTGAASLLRKPVARRVVVTELSPDGKTLLFWRPDADEPAEPTLHRLIARRLETGQEDEIFRVQLRGWGLGRIVASPDGRWLAFTVRGSRSQPWTVRVVPTSGGEAREVLSTREPENIWGDEMGWTPDSRYLLVVRHAGPPQGKTQLWRVPLEGGEPQKVGPPMEGMRFPCVHPDGRRISFTAGIPRRTEIWVMENFLPELRAGP